MLCTVTVIRSLMGFWILSSSITEMRLITESASVAVLLVNISGSDESIHQHPAGHQVAKGFATDVTSPNTRMDYDRNNYTCPCEDGE